jgi:4a-hydroxytetrahydrobiopterin dehydratase
MVSHPGGRKACTTPDDEDATMTTDPERQDPDARALRGQEVLEEGLDDWRLVLGRLVTRLETGTFAAGAALVQQVAAAADDLDHHPDVDLRYSHLTVTLVSHDVRAVTARDVRLARRISEIAAAAGVRADPRAVELLELALDTPDADAVRPFWQALLGFGSEHPSEVTDVGGRHPALWFQDTDSTAPDRQRFHLDVSVPHDVAEQRLSAALAAGGTLVSDERAPAFWVLADADGNQACICTWQNRD